MEVLTFDFLWVALNLTKVLLEKAKVLKWAMRFSKLFRFVFKDFWSCMRLTTNCASSITFGVPLLLFQSRKATVCFTPFLLIGNSPHFYPFTPFFSMLLFSEHQVAVSEEDLNWRLQSVRDLISTSSPRSTRVIRWRTLLSPPDNSSLINMQS